MSKPRQNTAEMCAELAQPILENLGLFLWDVRFEKEGSGWFLRYFIDKEGGVDINDCEQFSRAIDPVLDHADPIEQSYCLEVSSPGIERELTRPWHFEKFEGKQVLAKLIRPVDGVREFCGTLISHEGGITRILCDGNTVEIAQKQAASIRVCDDFDYNAKEENDHGND